MRVMPMMPAIMFMFAPPRGIFGVFPLFFLICVDCGLATSGRSQEFFCVGWTDRGAAAICPADTVNGLGLVAVQHSEWIGTCCYSAAHVQSCHICD